MTGTKEKILKQLADNPIIIYMKGVPSAPECGFSAKAVGILNATKVPYTYVDVLRAPFLYAKNCPRYPSGRLSRNCSSTAN